MNGIMVDSFNLGTPVVFPYYALNGSEDKHEHLTDVAETAKGIILRIDLAGYDGESVKVRIKDGRMYIYAKAKRCDAEFIRREIPATEFKRAYVIDGTDEDNIQACFKDGILEICLTKTERVANFEEVK